MLIFVFAQKGRRIHEKNAACIFNGTTLSQYSVPVKYVTLMTYTTN